MECYKARFKFFNFLLLDDDLGEGVGEVLSGDVGDDGVEVLAARTVLALLGDLTLDEDADALGDALDTAGPEEVVEGGIDTVVLSAHEVVGEGADLLDGGGGALVEGAALEELAHVDGALVGDGVGLALVLAVLGATSDTAAGDLSDDGVLSLLLGGHLGEDALPAGVVALDAGGDGLALVSDEGELLFLSEDLTLEGLLDHFLICAEKGVFLGVEFCSFGEKTLEVKKKINV